MNTSYTCTHSWVSRLYMFTWSQLPISHDWIIHNKKHCLKGWLSLNIESKLDSSFKLERA